jgi:TonB family protein
MIEDFMSKGIKILGLTIILVLAAQVLWPAENILIQVHVFRGTRMAGFQELKQIEVLTTSSRPELVSLKEKTAGSEGQLTAAVIDALLDIYDLPLIDDLFVHEKWWDGKNLHDKQWDGRIRPQERLAYKSSSRPDEVVLGKEASYRIKLSPQSLPSRQIALRLVVSKTTKKPEATGGDMETIVDRELVLDTGDPVIVAAPLQGQAYFMMVLATAGNPNAKKPEAEKARNIEIVAAPKAMVQVQPSYPEELRRRRIGGEIGLRIVIDEKGAVQAVAVARPTHPYLNYSAVQAIRQWTFEPVLIKGKPVPVMFQYTYNFYPSLYEPAKTRRASFSVGSDSIPQEALPAILERSGEYCQKLGGAVLDFVCEETIKETRYSLLKNIQWVAIGPRLTKTDQGMFHVIPEDAKPSEAMKFFGATDSKSELIEERGQNAMSTVTAVQIMDPKQTLRNSFICDYQMIRKAGAVVERRVILKENGRKNTDRNKVLDKERFSALSSLFAPLRVLAEDRQPRFDYRIVDEEKLNGKLGFVIEALPKSGDEDGIWSARVWVDKRSCQILKSEIKGVPIEGYEDVLNDCATLNIRPDFVSTHEYRMEKNGVLFPSRSKIHVAYPGIDPRSAIPKDAINLSYDKYKFFTVETESQVIKK